jgi:hypothetical protein
MAPVVHGLEAKYEGEMNFIYLDIDDGSNDSYKRELGYRVQPHFFLLNENGEIVQQWLGRVTSEVLEDAFEEALKGSN